MVIVRAYTGARTRRTMTHRHCITRASRTSAPAFAPLGGAGCTDMNGAVALRGSFRAAALRHSAILPPPISLIVN